MISYDKFWETLKEKGVSQYKLITQHGISNSQIDRIKKCRHVTTATLNKLCQILSCDVEDIITITPDKNSKNSFVALAEDSAYDAKKKH